MAATLLWNNEQQTDAAVVYSAGVHTFTIAEPGYPTSIGWAAGDILVVGIVLHSPSDGSGGTPPAPIGWTLHGATDQDCYGGNRLRTALYSRTRLAGDAATYTFIAPAATAQDTYARAELYVGRGVKGIAAVSSASTIVSIGAPYYPLNNVGLIPAKITSTGDVACCMLFSGGLSLGSDGNISIPRNYYAAGYPGVSTASIAQLPVAYDAIVNSPGTDGEGVVSGYRFNMVAKRNSGGFGASTI